MTPETVFSIASNIAVLSWLYLIVASPWTPRILKVVTVSVPVALSLLYVIAFALSLPELDGGFSSLGAVSTLFQNDWALLAGWVHYLAFDFFVGCWIKQESKIRDISHWKITPILIATFMLGPIGYLLFQALALTHRLKSQEA